MTDRELMQQALDVLEKLNKDGWILADFEDEVYASIEALRARLAQPEEPDWSAAGFGKPPQREWIGLTDEQIQQIEMSASSKLSAIYLAEAQLKGKNA